jgi:deazaflavin-dependent oxidoreductase (nitroreductase family)
VSSLKVNKIAEEKYIYLKTIGRNTGRPHEVELWFAVANGKIYLSHEGAYTDWMKNITRNGRVEFRIGNVHFKGKARIVAGGELFEIGSHALYLKYYGNANAEVMADWFSMSTIVEITCARD